MFRQFKKRSNEPELIDLGPAYYTLKEYNDCLYQLGRIGKLLGSDRVTIQAFQRLPFSVQSVLDVGCGGGHFTLKLAQKLKHTHITGLDIASGAITYAQKQQKLHNISNVSFVVAWQAELQEQEKSYDIVTATLVCHHLSDQALIDFIQRACKVARKAVIINDLHRHWLAYVGFACIGPLFFRNRLVQHDSLLSIKKGFTRAEWVYYLQQAGITSQKYSITWKWLFRWLVTIHLP